MKESSHTKPPRERLLLLPEVGLVGLVDLADPALPDRLSGKMSAQLEAFASSVRLDKTIVECVHVDGSRSGFGWTSQGRRSPQRCLRAPSGPFQ